MKKSGIAGLEVFFEKNVKQVSLFDYLQLAFHTFWYLHD